MTAGSIANGRVSTILAIVTALCWLVALFVGGTDGVAQVAGFVPRSVSGAGPAGALPFWLTPLTATLVHAGLFHVGFNMLMLVWCGRQVESALGGWMLALLYVCGAYAAAATEWALAPSSTTSVIGASGAVSAVLAVYALIFSEQKVRAIAGLPLHVVRALWLGASWVVIQALIGLAMNTNAGGIAVGAHIGGFAAGLLLARPMLRARFRQR